MYLSDRYGGIYGPVDTGFPFTLLSTITLFVPHPMIGGFFSVISISFPPFSPSCRFVRLGTFPTFLGNLHLRSSKAKMFLPPPP